MPGRCRRLRGNSVTVSCFVDADLAGNVVTRRSHADILTSLNNALISWFSKKQNTVECFTFGSEFVASRIAVEQLEALRCKLIDGPASVRCDNQSVVDSSSLPQRALQKKHNAARFHKVREAAALLGIGVAKIDGAENLAGALTKILATVARKKLLGSLCH